MFAAVALASLLTLPIWPVNPVKQDTAAFLAMEVTTGIIAPNGISATSGNLSTKLEMLIAHPFLIRAEVDYSIGSVMANRIPSGIIHGPTYGVQLVYYRGTNRMTGTVALGPVITTGMFRLSSAAADSLATNYNINDLSIRPAIGYRATFGLRIRRTFVIEVSLTSMLTDFVYREDLSPGRYTEITQEERQNDFRVSFGFIFDIKRFEHH
ncbi:MAG TPA: hypothetical protein PLF13_08135 [candidate division Zixibacteria bacterium]|nr:hypothetical protein [candidate division Zixibacteria bacterium]